MSWTYPLTTNTRRAMGVVVICRVSGQTVVHLILGVLSRDCEQMMSLILVTSSVLTPDTRGSTLLRRQRDRPLIVLIAPDRRCAGYFSPHTVYFRARNHERCQNPKIV